MSKTVSTKAKPRPWIPAGTNSTRKYHKPALQKPTGSKNVNPVSPNISPKKSKEKMDIGKEVDSIDKDPDLVSLSSQISLEEQQLDIHLFSMHKEMKLLYTYFDALKSSYMSIYRLFDIEDINDSDINELIIDAGAYVKELNAIFDDLADSVFELENTLDESQKELKYSEVYMLKEKFFSRLLNMYQKVIVIFQTIFEKQDFKELARQNKSLSQNLQLIEKASISQEAVIKDLERKLSIFESKTSAMESYKTNLESAKAELQKQLLHKDSQIKYLSNELMNSSEKRTNTDNEDFLEIIQAIKSKAQTEKSALKKALKYQRSQSEKKEQKNRQLMQELDEKEKIMFDLANQRDQLKIQLTVFNNNIIQQKTQIEEMKIQHLKLQNELTDKDITHKKEITELRNNLEERSADLNKAIKARTNLKKDIEELEDELQKSKEQLKNLKVEKENLPTVNLLQSKNVDVLQELRSLLQNTKEMFESFQESSHIVSGRGDQTISDVDYSTIKNELLAAVTETNEHLSELKMLYKAVLQEQKESPQHKQHLKKNDLERRLKKMDELYNAVLKENQDLRQEIEEMRSTSSTVQKTENYFTTNMTNDGLKSNLQLDLLMNENKIRRLSYDFKQREKDLEKQLKEYKEKLSIMEGDSRKISSLEEELKHTKLELSVLQKKKDEEAERLLKRAEDLQDSLDFRNKEYESLQKYVQILKSTYYKVFCDS